jgi:hypothetical protein
MRWLKTMKQKPILWISVVIIALCAAVIVQAALPAISLNSPASFPVDI